MWLAVGQGPGGVRSAFLAVGDGHDHVVVARLDSGRPPSKCAEAARPVERRLSLQREDAVVGALEETTAPLQQLGSASRAEDPSGSRRQCRELGLEELARVDAHGCEVAGDFQADQAVQAAPDEDGAQGDSRVNVEGVRLCPCHELGGE
jgi:hypothetical protein